MICCRFYTFIASIVMVIDGFPFDLMRGTVKPARATQTHAHTIEKGAKKCECCRVCTHTHSSLSFSSMLVPVPLSDVRRFTIPNILPADFVRRISARLLLILPVIKINLMLPHRIILTYGYTVCSSSAFVCVCVM